MNSPPRRVQRRQTENISLYFFLTRNKSFILRKKLHFFGGKQGRRGTEIVGAREVGERETTGEIGGDGDHFLPKRTKLGFLFSIWPSIPLLRLPNRTNDGLRFSIWRSLPVAWTSDDWKEGILGKEGRGPTCGSSASLLYSLRMAVTSSPQSCSFCGWAHIDSINWEL